MQGNDTTEPNQEAALNNEIESLPQKDREETKQILDEIGKENAPKSTPKVETTQKPKEADVKPADDGKKADEVTPKDESKRREKVVPAWMLNIANKRQEDKDKTIAELNRKLEEAQKGENTSKTTTSNEIGIPNTQDRSLEEAAREYAEQEGISIRLATDLITAKRLAETAHGKAADVDFVKDAIRKQQEEDANAREEQLFDRDFEKEIIPLIKKEYGDDVPASTLKQIKDDIKAKAYTEEFAKVPYGMIYKGDDSFRSLVPPTKRPVEGARTVAISEKKVDSQPTGKNLTEQLSDEEIKGLSDAEFDEYSKNMDKRQGSIR